MFLLRRKVILIFLHQAALFNLLKLLDTFKDAIVELAAGLGLVLKGLTRVV